MSLYDQLRRHAVTEARLVETLTDDFATEMERVLTRMTKQVASLVRQLETERGRLVATKASLGRALALRTQLQAALEAAGFQALALDAMDAPLDRLAATVLRGRSLAAQAARTTPIDLDTLTALKMLRGADLLDLGDEVVNAIWRSTLDGVIGLRDVATLTDELAALTEVSTRQARTLYDTAVSTYGRQVTQLGLDGTPTDRFLYIGPHDDVTRPFCRELIGDILTREQIDELDNGQLPNVLLTAGGYNCRHKWQFIGTLSESDLGMAS